MAYHQGYLLFQIKYFNREFYTLQEKVKVSHEF